MRQSAFGLRDHFAVHLAQHCRSSRTPMQRGGMRGVLMGRRFAIFKSARLLAQDWERGANGWHEESTGARGQQRALRQ